MLPQKNRLKHPKEFKVVYRTGITRKTSHLILRGRRREENSQVAKSGERSQAEAEGKEFYQPTRIGIAIAQKVSKRAVIRNRIKRRIRAGLRELLPRIEAGWDLVFIVRPAAVECNYRQLLQELEQLLAKAEVLNGDSRRDLL
ncbi:ribonuclease P protein component [Phormidium sp. CCY1219]|uniref:ribonuclease P protein component n=1 Tax=Phormidium sp. CCY1219 TaxID=2886104 RepID=UPI002D1F6473|nr:ribonuclease P protein component [Phormidium sp. CCY1219]MEB3827592.1 ribonuclease P protein component [Phormidium sp. CCY1219]